MRSGMNDRPLLAAAAATGRRLLVVICTLALVQAATRWTGSRPAAAFAVPGMALAQAAGESTRKTPALRNDVYEKLAEAQRDLTAEQAAIDAGEELACELQINGLSQTIRGRVIHVTPQRPGYSLAGLQFLDINGEIREKLLQFLQVSRKEKFRER